MCILRRVVFGAALIVMASVCRAETASIRLPEGTILPGSRSLIVVEIVKPEGQGPFPAVILLHDCQGVQFGYEKIWAERLVPLGYLVAIPDSFTSRGYPEGTCFGDAITPLLRVDDIYATLGYLEQRTDVQAERVGLVGFSHGAATILAAMVRPVADRAKYLVQSHHEFAAAIALYPSCSRPWLRDSRAVVPLLMLLGSRDALTGPCQKMADQAIQQGQPVQVTVYPEAGHAFDRTAGPARDDSILRAQAFFSPLLRPGPSSASNK